MSANPIEILFSLILTALKLLNLAILARILLSWVDPSPYPNTKLKAFLFRVTDPILEPLRRIIPPLGMIDISPMAAIIALQVVERALLSVMDSWGFMPSF